jgi:hypothetical protein
LFVFDCKIDANTFLPIFSFLGNVFSREYVLLEIPLTPAKSSGGSWALSILLKKDLIKMGKLEKDFQRNLIKELEQIYNNPDSDVITKFEDIQGYPDILILHHDQWAMLECKKSKDSPHRPNQDFYVNRLNKMSFARFIYPENKEEVLNDLQSTLQP